PQLFEGIFAFFVLGATGAFGCFGYPQLLNDFAYAFCLGLNRERARVTPDAAVALSLRVGKVERDHWDLCALDVFPNVQFSPMQQRMDADVSAFFEIGLELIPKFR